MNIVAKTRKWRCMAVWVTGALPPPHPPYPARRPDVPDAKHFPDALNTVNSPEVRKHAIRQMEDDGDFSDNEVHDRTPLLRRHISDRVRKPVVLPSFILFSKMVTFEYLSV
jgi:hypothetical protein